LRSPDFTDVDLDSSIVAVSVREVSEDEMLAFLSTRPDQPFQQRPSFAAVKAEWDHLLLGFYTVDAKGVESIVGSALVLLRTLPIIRASLAYVPEGPVVDWGSPIAQDCLQALLVELRKRRCFLVKIGPRLAVRRWSAATVKAGISDPQIRRLGQLSADEVLPAADWGGRLAAAGWRRYEAPGPGFGGTLQPRYGFEVPLAGRDLTAVRAGLSAQWRRNVTRATNRGLTVDRGGCDELTEFHALLTASGARGGFMPRNLQYYERMWAAMAAEDPDQIALYLGRRDGSAHAAMLRVASGDRHSYTYGGSDTEGRDLRPSNAVQWQMIADAHDAGATIFDLRGVSDTLDEADEAVGLMRFKVGLGGDAVEYLGEWDYYLRPVVARAFTSYWNRRPH
jgi:lipid II:glycine glycyltransferase (peptidoglycan interpeptide bridge formation enzyme)